MKVCFELSKYSLALFSKMPTTTDEWLQISNDYFTRWNFPNCLGSLDGKHIAIRCPNNSSSMNYNYKNTFSIVLLALADANYKLIYVDVGCKGRISDGGVFNNSTLYNAIERNMLGIPPPKLLPGSDIESPFVIVADDAFALKTYLMKPYNFRSHDVGERIFNYRISRARRMVESTFGLMASKFRVMRTTIDISEKNVKSCVLAICVLHNFLLTTGDNYIGTFDQRTDIETETETGNETNQRRNGSNDAKNVRDKLKEYFVGVGQVSWQNDKI